MKNFEKMKSAANSTGGRDATDEMEDDTLNTTDDFAPWNE